MMNERLEISEANPIEARFYDYDCFVYPWHFHSQYEIIYVKESNGICYAGDCIQKYGPGDVILLGANLPHYMRSDDAYRVGNPTLRVKGTIIQFEQNFLQYSINSYPQLVQLKRLLEDSRRGILFPRGRSEGISRQISQLPELKGFHQFIALMELLYKMSQLSSGIILASPNYHQELPAMGYKRIDKIIAFLNNNYTHHIKLCDVAKMANMNSSAFSRFFKMEVGKTFLHYVLEMRLGYACRLLALVDRDIAQIALESGFESVTNFNRLFKLKHNMTPKQYRIQMLK